MKNAFVAAVDWGTSSFRLWILSRTGEVLAERFADSGMASLKPHEFEPLLERNLTELGVGAETPALICGMAGAAQGWQEARYLTVPARLEEVAASAVTASAARRDVRILPGLAQRGAGTWDVMRGEETILLGAGLAAGISGSVCLPGTHSKWAEIEGNWVKGFSTAMTGEVFGLLARQSTLSFFLEETEAAADTSGAFADGVRAALDRPDQILRLLFSIRAMPLLLGAEVVADMPARLSGLLIGLELAGCRRDAQVPVTLISTGGLAERYASAFTLADIAYERLDAARMVRAGLFHSAVQLWPEPKSEGVKNP